MIVGGLMNLTLLDYPEKVACTVFTKGCNFRCPFCHNATLVNDHDCQDLTVYEVLEFLKKHGQGILLCLVIAVPSWFLGKAAENRSSKATWKNF